MINRLIRLSLASTALVLTSLAAAGDWEEVAYDKDEDIRVYTRYVEGSDMKAFKGITTIESTVTAPVALLQDVKRAHEWVFNCKAMDLIEEIAPNNATYYTVTSMPWPVKNRDNISESLVTQDASSGVVTVTIQARNDIFPSNDDHVRIRELDATWTLEPQAEGLLKVTYEAHADPGGGLPSWLVNSFVVEAPLNTLRDFRELVVDEKYQSASREYITH